MADKLYLVEISPAGAEIISKGSVMVQATSPAAAKKVALEVTLSARKVEALEVLALSSKGIGMLVAAEPEAAE